MGNLLMKIAYPQMISGDGLLSDISSFSVPWNNANIGSVLDYGYYSHSGQKIASPFIVDTMNGSSLSESERLKIAGMLVVLFNRKWHKLWSVYQSEYNPINNYNMVESETIEVDTSNSGTNTGTINTSNTGTITDSKTNTGTKTIVTDKDTTNTGTQTNSGSGQEDNDVFGFNSSVAVGSDVTTNSNSSTRTDNLASTDDITETETLNLADSNTKTLNTTDLETLNLADSNTKTLNTTDLETQNLAHSDTGSTDTTRELTRVGNIGVTTTQQMLESEIELWKWNFFKQVFEDIDSICCLSIY